jgi:plastocyanin
MGMFSTPTGRMLWIGWLAALLLSACGQAATASVSGAAPAVTAAAAEAPTTPTREPQPANSAAPVAVAGPQVVIDNFTFTPGTLTVAVGTTMTWINHDDVPHTVTAQDHTFTSSALDTDDHFVHQFTAAGTYAYYCTIHPKMTATIIVR